MRIITIIGRMLLEVENLRHAYGQHQVVAGLSFSLARGAIGCLLGPSGCGKTTVLRCIAGFETVQEGEIRLAGQIVSGAGVTVPPEKRRVGMVFQDYALFPHLTVAPRRARLLLDEPFSNLDVDLRERLSLEVRDIIKASGATAVLVTHDQQEAFAMADEIGVLHQGRIQQWDSPYNLYHRPANRFVADFVGQGVFLPAKPLGSGQVEIELGVLKGGQVPNGAQN